MPEPDAGDRMPGAGDRMPSAECRVATAGTVSVIVLRAVDRRELHARLQSAVRPDGTVVGREMLTVWVRRRRYVRLKEAMLRHPEAIMSGDVVCEAAGHASAERVIW